jgi:prepilin-type processing-associated H-X9-DG protein
VSNLRQLTLAWLLYPEDHDGWLPPNPGGWDAGLWPGRPSWVAGSVDYGNPAGTNISYLLDNLNGGSLGPYTRAAGVYRCPADRSVTRLGGSKHRRVRSYAINFFLGNLRSVEAEAKVFQRQSELGQPSPDNHFVFIDVHEDNVDDGEYVVGLNRTGDPALPVNHWADIPASRHPGAGVSFADGHVELKRWRDPRTLVPVIGEYRYGLASPANVDAGWVALRATRLKNQ